MTVEIATKISELVAENPAGSDPKSEGDNHLRLIKGVLQDVFDDAAAAQMILKEPRVRFTASGGTLTVAFLDTDLTTVLNSFSMAAAGLSAKLRTPTVMIDSAGITRAQIEALTTAGTGAVILTARDEAGDSEGQLSIGHVLQYYGDDATRILQLDQSRQAVGTQVVYMPARIIGSVPGLWEPIEVRNSVGGAVSNHLFPDLGDFRDLRIRLEGVMGTTGGVSLQASANNGSTWIAGTEYNNKNVRSTGTTAPDSTASNQSLWGLTGSLTVSAASPLAGVIELFDFGSTRSLKGMSEIWFPSATGFAQVSSRMLATQGGLSVALNAFQLFTGGTVDLRVVLEGVRNVP